MTRRRGVAAFGVVLVLVLSGVGIVIGFTRDRSPAPVTHRIDIPAGTADRIARGIPVKLIPDVFKVRLDDRTVITNDDVVTHRLGPYSVRAGERLEIHYTQAGVFPGPCSFANKDRVVVVVT